MQYSIPASLQLLLQKGMFFSVMQPCADNSDTLEVPKLALEDYI